MERLRQAIRDKRVILFVGAGVSMNLGLPSWEDLMRRMGEDLGYQPDEFIRLGHYLALAEFYRVRKGGFGDLVRWMDHAWHAGGRSISDSPAHRLIVELGFPIIYTTNYDRWLERAFDHYRRPYVKIVNVRDLLQEAPGVTRIVKYHGDFDDEASLTLNESSFFDRLEFESPLDIKLRSDSLARSVLFVGYSLSDINLRLLFYKLSKLWNNFGTGERPQSYLFANRHNPVQETVLAEWGITMIASAEADPQEGLVRFLAGLLPEGKGRRGEPA